MRSLGTPRAALSQLAWAHLKVVDDRSRPALPRSSRLLRSETHAHNPFDIHANHETISVIVIGVGLDIRRERQEFSSVLT
jgi:hypothetical protein